LTACANLGDHGVVFSCLVRFSACRAPLMTISSQCSYSVASSFDHSSFVLSCRFSVCYRSNDPLERCSFVVGSALFPMELLVVIFAP
jgi:hypothetical protein